MSQKVTVEWACGCGRVVTFSVPTPGEGGLLVPPNAPEGWFVVGDDVHVCSRKCLAVAVEAEIGRLIEKGSGRTDYEAFSVRLTIYPIRRGTTVSQPSRPPILA